MIVTQYFSELLTGRDPILDIIADHNYYDLWLYLEPDIKWVEDGFRSYGTIEQRIKNNEKLKKMLDEKGINYHAIGGSYYERITQAVKLVDDIL